MAAMTTVWRISEIQPPVTIEYEDDTGRLCRHRIIRKSWHNLFTDDDRVLWWPKIKWYEVRIVEEHSNEIPH